jgi:hypothetical protein
MSTNPILLLLAVSIPINIRINRIARRQEGEDVIADLGRFFSYDDVAGDAVQHHDVEQNACD